MRRSLVVLLLLLAGYARAESLTEFLEAEGQPPAEYLLGRAASHRIVLVGEAHWQRLDAELIVSLIPRLRERKVALAMETLGAGSQADIDALINAGSWDAGRANAILRAADWPYAQYREILRAAWLANRETAGTPPMRIIALGPPADFRQQRIRYDSFMADLIAKWAVDDDHRVVALVGMHHAFTRYQQVERFRNGRVGEFMDRFGNILWRAFGHDVFLVALHKAEGCGPEGNEFAALCAPLGGLIDCAASSIGPVGFDILGSPIEERRFDPRSFYAAGHPLLRMYDYADGYVWMAPVDATPLADLIPLEEYAPELTAEASSVEAWKKRADDLAHPSRRDSWARLPAWRDSCPPAAPR